MAGYNITGIPVYHVNRMISENLGDGSVLVVCGIQRGEDFTPLYATVASTDVAMTDGKKYLDAARGTTGITAH